MPWDDAKAREQVGKVEALLTALEALPYQAARDRATETVEALVDLYGECLARIMGHLEHQSDGDPVAALAGDELVSQLLLVHDLHPEPAERRVRRALDETQRRLRPEGGLELLGVDGGVARVALPGSATRCGSTSAALAAAVEADVRRLAPDIERVETVATDPPPAPPPLIPVEALFSGLRAAGGTAARQTGAG